MKNVLLLAAVGEIATGLALLIVPSLVGRLLLGAELAGVAVVVARVAGIALLALGVGCWPGPALGRCCGPPWGCTRSLRCCSGGAGLGEQRLAGGITPPAKGEIKVTKR